MNIIKNILFGIIVTIVTLIPTQAQAENKPCHGKGACEGKNGDCRNTEGECQDNDFSPSFDNSPIIVCLPDSTCNF